MLRISPVQFFIFLGVMIATGISSVQAAPVTLACNEFPPHKMEKSSDGLKGFDVDFLEAAFSRSGVKTEISFFPWKRAFSLVEKGTVDGLCSCSKTPEREELFFFSQVLGYVSSGLFSLTPDINQLDQNNILKSIGNKSVGVGRGYTLNQNLLDAGVQKIREVSDAEIGVKMLSMQRFDYYYGYHAPTIYLLKSLGIERQVYYREVSRTPYFTCFSKATINGEDYRDQFDKGLMEIRQDGTYDQILTKYR